MTRVGTPLVIGCSFRNSTIGYREKLALALETATWQSGAPIDEWALLTTCNRVEIILSTSDPEAVTGRVLKWSKENLGEAPLYVLKGRDALVHLFRVASGLDSMIVNDGQILGQLRRSGKVARMAGSSRIVLSPLFDVAVSVGKRVRPLVPGVTDTVGGGAVAFAVRKLGHKPKSVLLVGTGKMSRSAAASLKGSKIMILSHRRDLPSSLSNFELIGRGKMMEALRKSELVVCATKSKGYVIKKRDIDDTKKRIILDLGFPRNVDPKVRGTGRVDLYDLDDLAKGSTVPRRPPVAAAERAVEAEAESFERWLNASKLSTEVSTAFRWAEEVRNEETAAALRRLEGLSPRQKEIVEAMGRRIISKVLARPAAFAKLSTPDLPQAERMRLLRELFSGVPR